MFEVGQVYFWKDTDSFFGKAINFFNLKTFGRSDVTHCGIISSVGEFGCYIYEAGDKGFTRSFYDNKWLVAKMLEGKVKIGKPLRKVTNINENCEKYKDIGYGWLDILSIGIGFLTGFRLSFTGKGALICSEAVSRVLYDSSRTIDFQEEYGIPYDQITPQHIFQSKFIQEVK